MRANRTLRLSPPEGITELSPVVEAARRFQGEIVEWSDEKRCGFVRPRGNSVSDPVVFLPISSFITRKRDPMVGDVVQYELETLNDTPENRRMRTKLRAIRVLYLGDDLPSQAPHESELAPCVLGAAYSIGLMIACFIMRTPYWPFFWSLALSGAAFFAYAWDKEMARRDAWRVAESSLQLLALLGGWPGAAVAQTVLRHKTRKESFRRGFHISIATNLVLTTAGFVIYHVSKS